MTVLTIVWKDRSRAALELIVVHVRRDNGCLVACLEKGIYGDIDRERGFNLSEIAEWEFRR